MSPLAERRVVNEAIAETLRQAAQARWSGLLRVLDGREHVGSLVVRDGRLAWATARGQREDLAGALLRAGAIDEATVALVRRRYQTPGKLGALAALLEREHGLPRAGLRHHALRHVRDVVYGIVARDGLTTAAAGERIEADAELTFGWDEIFVEDALEGGLAVRPCSAAAASSVGEPVTEPGLSRPAIARGSAIVASPQRQVAAGAGGAAARSIALVSASGGAGATTTALNLAVAFAGRGRPTLLVDTDPQGGVARALGRGDGAWVGLNELLAGAVEPEAAVQQTRLDGLSVAPTGRLGAAAIEELERRLASGALEDVLRALEGGFEVVIVDTPTGLGPITRAVLWAADFALVPVRAEPAGSRALDLTLAAIEHASTHANPRLQLLGIVPTMVRAADRASAEAVRGLRAARAGVLHAEVPASTLFAAAAERGLPLAVLGGPGSAEARCFDALGAECEDLMVALSSGDGAGPRRP